MIVTVIGLVAYRLLRSQLVPDKTRKKTFKSLREIVIKHYNPAPSKIAQRYKFSTHLHQPTECVAVYASEFCSLAEHCNYGVTQNEILHY